MCRRSTCPTSLATIALQVVDGDDVVDAAGGGGGGGDGRLSGDLPDNVTQNAARAGGSPVAGGPSDYLTPG